MSDPVQDAVEAALWQRVVDDFDDSATHSAFLEHSQRSDTLVAAATRYRRYKERLDPETDAERLAAVDKRLGAIASLAMAQLNVERSETPEPRRSHPVLIALSVLILLVSLFGLYHAMSWLGKAF